MKIARSAVTIAAVAILLVLGIVSIMGYESAEAQGGAYDSGTVMESRTLQLVQPTPVTGSGTAYSDSPNTALSATGEDYSRVGRYHSVDLFVNATITAPFTTTVQFSADGTNWADAYYVEPSFNSSGTLTSNTVYRRVILSSSGTDYASVPIAGEYMRVKMEHTGPVTPTVWGTFRND